MVDLLRKLSAFEKVVEHLERYNLPEALTLFLLANKVHSALQFENREFVEELREQLQQSTQTGDVRICSWRPSCWEFEGINHAHMASVIGPNIPLIAEYRHALELYRTVAPCLSGTFRLVRTAAAGTGPEQTTDNWHRLIEIIREETFKGSHLQRYKGLGEMNPEQLWDTTMNPANRTLVQVRIDDLEVTDDMFTTLMGDKVEPRREFIQNHALEVADLDI